MEFYNKNQIVQTPLGIAQITIANNSEQSVRVKHLQSKTPITDFRMSELTSAERLNTQIKVGETYLNRGGVPMDVIQQLNETEFHITNKDGVYNAGEYGNGYVVSINGSFGNTPNPRDLVFKTK